MTYDIETSERLHSVLTKVQGAMTTPTVQRKIELLNEVREGIFAALPDVEHWYRGYWQSPNVDQGRISTALSNDKAAINLIEGVSSCIELLSGDDRYLTRHACAMKIFSAAGNLTDRLDPQVFTTNHEALNDAIWDCWNSFWD